jgi:hypothetical protein
VEEARALYKVAVSANGTLDDAATAHLRSHLRR